MYCPRCGGFVDQRYARFCQNCGNDLSSYIDPFMGNDAGGMPPFQTAVAEKPKSSRNKAIALGLVLVIALGIIAGALFMPEEEVSQKIDIQTINDGEYFELSGDFLLERDIFTVSLTDDGKIAFALNSDISSKYVFYSWKLFDEDRISSTSDAFYSQYTGDTIDKAEPVLYYLSQKVGEYDISVRCYAENDPEHKNPTTYSGTVSYIGTITKEYTWMYLSVEYSATVTFNYKDYREYREMKTSGRSVYFYSASTSFVTYTDPTVVSLAKSLAEAYGDGSDILNQDFASYILAFVQICFDYPPYTADPDKYQYGQTEYFAYPLETIYYGMGDCEDTSILAAALFKALGFKAGVVIVPGHALAAVGLGSYDPGTYSHRYYEIIDKTISGVKYYACETTVDSPQGIGLVSLSGYEGEPYSDYVDRIGYGFFIV